MSRLSLLVIFALILFGAPEARAWNATGHMTMAMLAYRQLTPEERTAVSQILRKHPHYESYLIKNVPPGVNLDEWVFIRAATWADFVRPSGEGAPVLKDQSITRFHHAGWHHLEIPYILPDAPVPDPANQSATRTTIAPAGSISRLYDPEGDALSVLDDMTARLSATQTTAGDRAVALAWILHLVGDMHQPCHVTTLFSKQYPYPDGDSRGNEQTVRTEAGTTSLHGLWDKLLGNATSYDAIAFLADDIAADPRCDVKRTAAYTRNNTPGAWAQESYRMAIAFVYLDGQIKSVPTKAFHDKSIAAADVPAVPMGYVQTARDVARVRIALSAARLAETLRKTLPKQGD